MNRKFLPAAPGTNLPAAFGSRVKSRTERATNNTDYLSAAPTLHSQQTVAASGGDATVSIIRIVARSATPCWLLFP